AGAALAETGTVVLEVKHDGVLAGRERRWTFPAETFGSELDIGKDRLALDQVETITAKDAAVRIEHPLGSALRNVHLGRDGEGLAEGAGGVSFWYTGHFAGIGKDRLAGGGIRSRGKSAFGNTVIQRKYIVFRRLDQEELLHITELVRHLGGEVVALRVIFGDVVKLPFVAVDHVGRMAQ